MQQNLRMHAGTAAADRAGTWMKLGWLAIAVGGIYILSAKLSLSLLTPDGVAVFWPAAGVAAGALIASGPWARWWPGRWLRPSWPISWAIETS